MTLPVGIWGVEVSRMDEIARRIRTLEPTDVARRLSKELVDLPMLPPADGLTSEENDVRWAAAQK